ncbi:hypothetical protein D3C72_2492730 [compost metagenome]
MVIYPSFIPQLSSNILTKGATLLVVQEALDRIEAERSTALSLIPNTTVAISLSAGGAEIITFFAPAVR